MAAKKIHVLACSDKFKDSATADEINSTICEVITCHYGDRVTTSKLYLSDGGDGFLASLKQPLELEFVSATVTGPLCTPLEAKYGINIARRLAVIEMATASGLELVPDTQRNPMNTTTLGTGELIKDAYMRGCRKVLLGIGGSATSDGGLGALQALGLQLYAGERPITEPACGRHMTEVTRVDFNSTCPDLEIDIACDVTSPFVGPMGAVYVFSKQKGATPEMQKQLEAGMHNLVEIYRSHTGVDLTDLPGAGAAGGIGGALHSWMKGELMKGIEIMGSSVGLEEEIAKSQLVVTGEGKFDSQTAAGKVVSYVQELCARHNVPWVVVCGSNESGQTENVYDLMSTFPLQECMTNALKCLREILERNISEFPALND